LKGVENTGIMILSFIDRTGDLKRIKKGKGKGVRVWNE